MFISNRELQQSLANTPVGAVPNVPKHHEGRILSCVSIFYMQIIYEDRRLLVFARLPENDY
jgi:starvation-inducible outer membrane lipoprotein